MSEEQNVGTFIRDVCTDGGDLNLNISGHVNFHVGNKVKVQKPEESPEVISNEKILHTVNQNMWEKVDAKIMGQRIANTEDLEPEVYPQIVRSPGFYRGERAINATQSSENVPDDSKRPEYVKEKLFNFRMPSEQNFISFESVIHEMCKSSDLKGHSTLYFIGLFSQAGSGKSTCMRRWCKQIMKTADISEETNYLPRKNSRFQLVLFYDLKSIMFQKETSLQEILLNGIFRAEDEKTAYDWITKNESQVILFFDGLDQTTWTIDGRDQVDIGPHKSASTSTIMYNLFSRHLLPKSRVVLSSREFKASALPVEARPRTIFTLNGFSKEDAEKLFNKLVTRDRHENPWTKLSNSLSSLQHILTIPMFLIFAAIVYEDCSGFIPDNVTELMAKILDQLKRSPNVQEKHNISEIISKLKGLAHSGMEKGQVVFTDSDLKNHNLTAEDVRDLLFTVPAPKRLPHHLFKGDLALFFCHQSLQEFLSACYITEMSCDYFKTFVQSRFCLGKWSVVRRFVSGILRSNYIKRELVQVTDADRKKGFLHENLICSLKSARGYQLLELYAVFYESEDGKLIQSNVHEICLEDTSIGNVGANLISSLMGTRGQLDLVSLVRCDITDELLNTMSTNWRSRRIRVKVERIRIEEDWHRSRCFKSSSFTDFLENIESDVVEINNKQLAIGPEGFNWENIRRLELLFYIHPARIQHSSVLIAKIFLINEKDVVYCNAVPAEPFGKIVAKLHKEKQEFHAHFRVWVERCDSIHTTIQGLRRMLDFFNADSINWRVEGISTQQYISHENIDAIGGWTSCGEAKEVVCACMFDLPIHEEAFSTFVNGFQVKVFNLALPVKDLHWINPSFKHAISRYDCQLIINVCESVGSDILELRNHLLPHLNQIDCLRLMITSETSLNNLVSFLENCNVTRQEWAISQFHLFQLSTSDQELLQETAADVGVSLVIRTFTRIDHGDAWSKVYFRMLGRN